MNVHVRGKCVLCITRVTRESHVLSHSHAIWTKSRVRGAFGFGWHYLESKYNFDHLFLFPNSTLFQTQILFRRNMTLAGILRYQLVPEQALNTSFSKENLKQTPAGPEGRQRGHRAAVIMDSAELCQSYRSESSPPFFSSPYNVDSNGQRGILIPSQLG